MTIFIQKGDAPLSKRQAYKRGIRHVEREMSAAGFRHGDREFVRSQAPQNVPQRVQDSLAKLGVTSYEAYALNWEADNEKNAANNLFNHQLAAYHKATERLVQYRLADGRAAYQVGTGRFVTDPDTLEQVEVMQDIPAIDPLVAEMVEYPVYDEAGNQTGTVTEPHRETQAQIDTDDAERAEAQAVIDATPQEVKDF